LLSSGAVLLGGCLPFGAAARALDALRRGVRERDVDEAVCFTSGVILVFQGFGPPVVPARNSPKW